VFIGLNPSTATETEDDPTIRRCLDFSRRWGFQGYVMLNLYAYRATLPVDMVTAAEPFGPENEATFAEWLPSAGLVVAAWGSLKQQWRTRVHWQARIKRLHDQFITHRIPVCCLGFNADREPKHPLYLPKSAQRISYFEPKEF
jgi:hypothetical protein